MAQHLIWDWNGTLLDDLSLVVAATNVSLAFVDGPQVTADEHRRGFRRPISAYYEDVLGRQVVEAEFTIMDRLFHDTYRAGMAECRLAWGVAEAMAAWPGSQSLVSMFFHHELVSVVDSYGLTDRLQRVDGLRGVPGGGPKAPHLRAHLSVLGLVGDDCVLIGDSLDDAAAAASVGACIVLYCGGFTDEDRLRATGLPVATTLVEAVDYARAV